MAGPGRLGAEELDWLPVSDPIPATTDLPRTDKLAVERTLLANERTFLAYFRTSVVFLSSGSVGLGLEVFENIRYLAVFLILLAVPVFFFGLWRYRRVRQRTLRYLNE